MIQQTGQPADEVLHQQLERKTLLLDVLSHELLSHVTAILGFTDLLRSSDSPAWSEQDRDRFLSRIAWNAGCIEEVVSNVIDLANLEAGKIHVRRSPTDMAELVAGVLDGVALAGHPVHVYVDQPTANVDRFLVKRIIENLVGNALRHTPPGAHVALRVEDAPSGLRITVADNGHGIPRHQRTALFERLSHPEPGLGGAGLGLSIVRRFADIHGGEVSLGDEPGGAVFEVVLSTVDGVGAGSPSLPFAG